MLIDQILYGAFDAMPENMLLIVAASCIVNSAVDMVKAFFRDSFPGLLSV
jgi:uncharacterized protein (DUF4213/DUF364 family)